jgi:hypothetical protein
MNKDCELEDEEGELVEVTASSAIYMAPKSGDDSLSKSQKAKHSSPIKLPRCPQSAMQASAKSSMNIVPHLFSLPYCNTLSQLCSALPMPGLC